MKNFRTEFEFEYENLSESEIQREILFNQLLMNKKLEKIRNNTSNLVWFLIVFPLIIGVIIFFINNVSKT